MFKRVFILDDVRSISTAHDCAGVKMCKAHFSLARNMTDAFEIVESSLPFDFWILDNDLGEAEEGYQFLKDCIERHPDKIPSYLQSCSSNPLRRKAINDLHSDWIAGGRHSMIPLGAEGTKD